MLGGKAFFLIFGGVCASASAAPAQAQDNGTSESLSIEVTATIAERCGIAAQESSRTRGVPELESAESLDFDFSIDCNTPFRIGLSSQYGALRLTSAPGKGGIGEDGFSIEKPYQVGLKIDTDGEPMAPDACSSRDLMISSGACAFFGAVPGKGMSSDKRTAIDRTGTITVSWPAEDGSSRRRAAGEYQDIITVVVGART